MASRGYPNLKPRKGAADTALIKIKTKGSNNET
jgi:hypothetical protein